MLAFAVFGFQFLDSALYLEAKLDKGDWITAHVEIVDGPDGSVDVIYEAMPTRHVKGLWYAILYDEHGKRLATRSGEGNYNPNKRDRKHWLWSDFFDGRDGIDPPTVPREPFYVCVFYVVAPLNVDYTRESPTRCSEIYTPKG